MKSKVLLFSLIALAIAGCDDDINLVGPTIQPPGDDIVTYVDSFQVKAKTVYIDSIYAKTSQALLGEFEDPTYGSMKAEFMCQFYCKDDFSFRHEPIDGKIDSMQYILRYTHKTGWVGDSIAPQQMKVYKITSPLTENFYIDKVNPRNYCDMSQMLGSKVFTAIDQSVPQHIRDSVDPTYKTPAYFPYIAIDFPKELGQQIYDATVQTPEHFRNQETFNNFFPGLYVTTDPGTTGCILKLDDSFMAVYYNYNDYVKASDGTDSLVVRSTNEVFRVTSEIIQLSHISNSGIDELLKPNDRLSYLKSPAGIYTQITFPIKEIAEQLGPDRVITNLPFSLSFLPPDPWEYALNPPGEVLLIPKDSLQAFFLEKRLTNNKTTFMSDNYIKKVTSSGQTSYINTYMYNFNNISAFLENQLEVAPDKDIEMLIVPVTPVTRTVGSGYNQTTITTRIDNYFEPSGVKLKTDEASLKIGVRSAGVQKQ